MPTLNQCFIMGHLGKDAEMSATPSGTTVTKFSVATSEKYTAKDGEKKENTDWHNLVCFGKTAEFAQRLKKGQLVFVRGKIRYRTWENDAGDKKYFTDIIVDDLKVMTWPERDEMDQTPPSEKPRANRPAGDEPPPLTDDDLPF